MELSGPSPAWQIRGPELDPWYKTNKHTSENGMQYKPQRCCNSIRNYRMAMPWALPQFSRAVLTCSSPRQVSPPPCWSQGTHSVTQLRGEAQTGETEEPPSLTAFCSPPCRWRRPPACTRLPRAVQWTPPCSSCRDRSFGSQRPEILTLILTCPTSLPPFLPLWNQVLVLRQGAGGPHLKWG